MAWLKTWSGPGNCGCVCQWGRRRWLAAALLFWMVPLRAQAQDATVRGVVSDSGGQPLAGAKLTATLSEAGFAQTTTTDSQGEYYFGSLPRGSYSFKVELSGYTGLEKRGIELAVGAKHGENFALTPLSTTEAETAISGVFNIVPPPQALPVETIASSVSVVVDETKILDLPLENRNIYSLFLLQPGVTSQGAVGARGLTFSVNGQRVSVSNYELDGVDNNDIILTGPVAATSAEAIQEFRMVNSSLSAGNGRASAFVAQVVTRSGSNRFHGSLLEFVSNDKFDANTAENISNGDPKPPLRQNQFAYSLGAPIAKNRTFFFSALEFSRLRFGTPKGFTLPTAFFIANLPADSEARSLLTKSPPLAVTPSLGDPNFGTIRYQVPSRVDTVLATERLDHHFANAKDRLMARFTLALTSAQDGEDEFTGYPSLTPTDHYRAYNTMIGWNHSFDSGRVNDVRIGWSREQIEMPQPNIPVLQSGIEVPSGDRVSLPGSGRLSQAQENNNVVQVSDTFSLRRGRSAWTVGFEYRRNLSNGISQGLQNEALGGIVGLPKGAYLFPNLAAFASGQADLFGLGVDRFSSGHLRLPDLGRKYRSNDFAAFIQDDIKLSRRLSLNLGLRYEYFGVPHDTLARDLNFYFGDGSTFDERLANGVLRTTNVNTGDLKGLLYRRDRVNFAPSIGIAWDPFGHGRTVLRAGYAVAFDRIFDTLRDLRSNDQAVAECTTFANCTPSFLIPAERMLPQINPLDPSELPPGAVVQLDENLRTPYAQNWYLGVQQTVTPNFLVEIGHAGSLGRKLISRNDINRSSLTVNPANPHIGADTYLSNADNSSYLALEVGLRRRFSRGLQYQVSYTYSHAIDYQSDPFEGVVTGPGPQDFAVTTFTNEFDPRLDRGNANFDQRQNLVFNATWNLPAPRAVARSASWLFEGWTASVIGAYRSGFPVTAIGFQSNPFTTLENNRVDFLGGRGQPLNLARPTPVPGGVQWLDPSLFSTAVDHVGNVGRGAIRGPGFWNYDFALLRNVALSDRGVRIQFRAEFYNLLNHANLSPPVSSLSDPYFGQAFYGLNQTFSRFGDLSLASPSRRIQLGLRIEF
jgi:Carboxypeptidase regulatory-like domain/TonB dependent receptor